MKIKNTIDTGIESQGTISTQHLDPPDRDASITLNCAVDTGVTPNETERLAFLLNYIGFLFDFNNTAMPIDNLFSAQINYIMPHVITAVFRHPVIPGRLCIISILKGSGIYSDLTYDIKIFAGAIASYRLEKHDDDYLIIATEYITNKICWHFISAKTTHFYESFML